MDRQSKKFIAPGSWFSLRYPSGWSEFEDMEESFLFYNPEKWSGNFRISAFRSGDRQYAEKSIREELKQNGQAEKVNLAGWECAYGKETFQEEGTYYTTHLWITGKGNLLFECSFTVPMGGDAQPAEKIIESLEICVKEGFSKEIIPVRVLEIGLINEGYEWTSATVKKILKKDFMGVAADIPRIQQVMETGNFKSGQKEVWQSLGIAFGAILVNEIDGMEWVTVVDGSQEYPALRYEETDILIRPAEMIWEKVKNQQHCILSEEFDCIKKKVEELYK